jgi:hypothetical protein
MRFAFPPYPLTAEGAWPPKQDKVVGRESLGASRRPAGSEIGGMRFAFPRYALRCRRLPHRCQVARTMPASSVYLISSVPS